MVAVHPVSTESTPMSMRMIVLHPRKRARELRARPRGARAHRRRAQCRTNRLRSGLGGFGSIHRVTIERSTANVASNGVGTASGGGITPYRPVSSCRTCGVTVGVVFEILQQHKLRISDRGSVLCSCLCVFAGQQQELRTWPSVAQK